MKKANVAEIIQIAHCAAKIVSIALIFVTAACSNPLGGSNSHIDPGHHPGVSNQSIAPSSGNEFVSASAQMKPTLGSRFQLQGTLSSPTHQVIQTTQQRGYKLFSNVQGQFISSGKEL